MNAIDSFWRSFQQLHPEFKSSSKPIHYYFCDNHEDADVCAELVVKGIKQATATSLWWYAKHDKPLPKVGDLAIITNWEGIPRAITRVTAVNLVAYNKISAAFAHKEGEGDKSLSFWKKVHWDYYSREMAPFNEYPTEDMIIVCEEFETIYKLSN